jgi:hypothetical protein
MSIRQDPIATGPLAPERLHFATGILLDAEDFRAEQLYHRGRLARSLAYLHGHGTIAGLRVDWESPLAPGDDPNFPDGREERLTVQPGLAVDRLGRLIEVPEPACIRLDRWYRSQEASRLSLALHEALTLRDEEVEEGTEAGDADVSVAAAVVADIFLRFVSCERGKTPAFAAGPFDALDAVQPSRLRDGYALELLLRDRPAPPPPLNPWQAVDPAAAPAERAIALRKLVYGAWREATDDWDAGGPVPLPEHAPGQDTTALFLARVVIPAAAGTPPIRTPGAKVYRQNAVRRFVLPSGLLAHLLGVL